MLKNKGLRCFSIVLIMGFFLAALLSAVYFFYLGPKLLEDKRVASVPPTVIVHTPTKGDTVSDGDLLTASATATSRNPIARLEVWLNGEKYQEQTPQGSLNTFYASFEIEITEGTHLLVFRAVDSAGLVGQSPPIPITGTPALATLVTEEGQTLQEIAQALGEAPEDLKNLNPGLGNAGLPTGTKVKVPKPPAQPGGAGQAGGPGDGGNNKPPDSPPDISKAIEVQPINLPVISAGDLISALIASMPKAPSSFYAKYEDCVVELYWYDNAVNETHFNIWMQRVYGPPQLIATTPDNPSNGPTTYKFKSPIFGFYSFWVEAANSLGGQPSEIKEVYVSDKNCGGNLATELEIEALDMYVYAPYERIYCYLSLDGGEHRLIPESGFIHVNNNWGDITKHWGGEKRILYPMPEDEELTLSGSCLANLGPLQVSPFTNFNTSVPREKWDGSRLEIKTESFLVGYRVQPHGPEQASGAFEYINYGLNPPDIWKVEAQGEPQFPEKDWKARTVTLSWHWQGDTKEITNFLILIDGKDYRYVNKNQRQETILMGSACGQEYAFEMVAIGSGGARSAPSTRRIYTQPPCPVMAEVHFLTVISKATDDTDCIPPFMHTCFPYTANACNPLGVKYELWVMGAGHKKEKVKYGTWQNSIYYECGIEYQFSNQLRATQDKFIVPVDPSVPEIRFGTTFWDTDGGPNDTFGKTDFPVRYDYDKWPGVDEIFTLTTPFTADTADATIKVRVRGFAYAGGSLDLYTP